MRIPDLSHPSVRQYLLSGDADALRSALEHLIVVTPMRREDAEASLRQLRQAVSAGAFKKEN